MRETIITLLLAILLTIPGCRNAPNDSTQE